MKNKIPTRGGQQLVQNPFEGLSAKGLPANLTPAGSIQAGGSTTPSGAAKNRGRVDIVREKNGRGGKTVTIVTGWVGIGLTEKEMLTKKMQKACGVGGTVKEGRIEIQGDKRDEVSRILSEAGFRPVLAGG
jgi:translation initiation factor 1